MTVFAEFAVTLVMAVGAAMIARILELRFRDHPSTVVSRFANLLFVAQALAYILVFCTLSLLRHASFHSGGFDLGIFDQNIWNSLHGRLFQNSIAIESTITLGQHFSPLLLSLVPLYALWSDARLLLILQTFALALSAVPLYWFARNQIGTGLAIVVTAAYFLFPSLQYVNLFEFHEVALAMPLLGFALYFLLRRRLPPFLICLALALLVKEEIGFIVAACGVFIFFSQRKRGLGVLLTVLGISWAVIALLYIIPSFRDPIQGTTYQYVDRYLYLGKNVPEIVTTIVTQPDLVVQHLFVQAKIEFVLQLLIPLAFIPLIGAEISALALPTLGYLLLGDNAFQNSIHFQYTALLIPFLFFATVVGLKRLGRTWGVAGATLLLVGSLVNYYFQGAGPLARHFDPSSYAVTPHVQLGHQILNRIPLNAPVMADSNLVPHLSDRQFIYQASVVPDLRRIEYVMADTTLPIYTEYKWIWDDVLPSPFFETVAEQDGYILKKHVPYVPARSLSIQFGDRLTLLGYTIESNLPAQRNETASIVLVWRADQAIREQYVIFIHLVDAQDHIWAQGDREPANGWFRTDRWKAGDITPDRYWLELPGEMPQGRYTIAVGIYDPVTGVRLKMADGKDNMPLTSIDIH